MHMLPLSELKLTTEQLDAKLNEFQNKSQTVDANSPEGAVLAKEWTQTILQLLNTDENI
jgi:hypothetical protein